MTDKKRVSNPLPFPYLERIRLIMDEEREKGKEYIRMDVLAARLKEQSTDADVLPGEVVIKKLGIYTAMEEMGDVTLPWEVVAHRGRLEKGVDFESFAYKEQPIKNKDGTPQLKEDGTPKMQRYFWPALVFKNEAREAARMALQSLVNTLQLPPGFTAKLDKDSGQPCIVIIAQPVKVSDVPSDSVPV